MRPVLFSRSGYAFQPATSGDSSLFWVYLCRIFLQKNSRSKSINRKISVLVEIFPSMVVVKYGVVGPKRGGGKRERVKGFTKQARLRMIKFLHSVEFTNGLLITLTYGRNWEEEAEGTKAHLQAFRRGFERLYGKVPVVWKLELQKRGAPHYHLFVLRGLFVDIPVVSGLWHKITGSNQDAHLKNGVDVKAVSEDDGIRNVGAYVGKYVSKLSGEEEEEEIKYRGRYWGHWNVKIDDPVTVEMDRGSNQKFVEMQISVNEVKTGPWLEDAMFGYTMFTGASGSKNGRKNTLAICKELGKI